MNKQQILLIAAALCLALFIYFGLDTNPPSHKLVEKSRALNFEVTNIEALRDRARNDLDQEETSYLASLENVLRLSPDDSVQVQTLQQLSGAWFELGHPEMAGYYAQTLAEKDNTAERWAIAGSTYAYGFRSDAGEDVKNFCFERAVKCFENAISLEPENPEHRINLAICFAEKPTSTDPMRGIRDLIALSEEYPDNAAVRFHLGRFAVQTGQQERAIQRLEEALDRDSTYMKAHCLLAQVYEGTDQVQNAVKHREYCESRLNHQ